MPEVLPPIIPLPTADYTCVAASSRTERWKPQSIELHSTPRQDAINALSKAVAKLVVKISELQGVAEPTKLIFSTAKHLHAAQADRERALLGKLDQELTDNAHSIAHIDRDTLCTRGRVALRALLRQNVPTLTLSVTSDLSLYFRAHLAAGQGTLHLEIFAGPDADPEEDTLATLYQGPHQRWALGGTFLSMMDAIRLRLTASSSEIGTIR